MGIFVRNTSIAVTWTSHSCQAVRLCGSQNGCEVAAAWSGETGPGEDTLSGLIARAVREVGGNDSIYVIAGGSGRGWGMADLSMPRLKSEELRNALEFEVRKQTPLPGDKFRWGYRLLPKKDAKDAMRPVRLYYVRNEHWDSWQKAVSSLHHVDALIPAPIALDPVLQGVRFDMPEGEHGTGYVYQPEGDRRVVIPAPGKGDDLSQLEMPGVKIGVLAQRTPGEQQNFAPAIVLAMYGMTEAVNNDANTLIRVPEHLVAHRYIALKSIAACLAVYLVCMIVFAVAGSCQTKAAQIRRVEMAIDQTRKELEAVNKLIDPNDSERAALLRKELEENSNKGPDFPTVLMEVTQAIKPPAWVSQSLEWKDGVVTVQVQSPTKDLELVSRLEASPYIGDVIERLSTFNPASAAYVQRFEMIARADSAEEKEILKLQREKERAREEAAEAERKKAEAALEAESQAETPLEAESQAEAPLEAVEMPQTADAPEAETLQENDSADLQQGGQNVSVEETAEEDAADMDDDVSLE